jgi:hypothetical protein
MGVDMHNENTTIEAVLGTLSAGTTPPPKGLTEKLASVKVGEPESFYMLATYCFDLSRKLQYLSKAARPFMEHIPADLEQEIEKDTQQINGPNMSWKDRAEVAEKIMLRLHDELEHAAVG